MHWRSRFARIVERPVAVVLREFSLDHDMGRYRVCTLTLARKVGLREGYDRRTSHVRVDLYRPSVGQRGRHNRFRACTSCIGLFSQLWRGEGSSSEKTRIRSATRRSVVFALPT